MADAELALRRAAWQPRPQKPNTKGVLNNYARRAHCCGMRMAYALGLQTMQQTTCLKGRTGTLPDHFAPGSWRPRMSARLPPEYYLLTTS